MTDMADGIDRQIIDGSHSSIQHWVGLAQCKRIQHAVSIHAVLGWDRGAKYCIHLVTERNQLE